MASVLATFEWFANFDTTTSSFGSFSVGHDRQQSAKRSHSSALTGRTDFPEQAYLMSYVRHDKAYRTLPRQVFIF
jgi:hypothetical protein